MQDSYVVTGTMENERLVRLDVPVSLQGERVRITLEPLPAEQRDGKTLVAWIKNVRRDLGKKGYPFRTKSEIDQQVHDEREGWGSL